MKKKFKDLKTGDVVKCVIDGHKVDRAIVEVPEKGVNQLYLCQNKASGSECENKHGMRFSWVVDFDDDDVVCDDVSDVVIVGSKSSKKDNTVTITYNRDGVEYTQGFIDGDSVEDIRTSVAEMRKELSRQEASLKCYTNCAKRGWVIKSRPKTKK